MKLKNYFFFPKREINSELDEFTNRLIQGCFIYQESSGIYCFSNLALRILDKISNIIRKNLNKINGNEILLPIMQLEELWIKSKKVAAYGDETFKCVTNNKNYIIAPTAESSVTNFVHSYVKSYKQLPLSVYQIHWKYRNELRPRFGLIRCKEFLMKDAYSFDKSKEDAEKTYINYINAYKKIFEEMELNYLIVPADSGQIGGDLSHEFVLLNEFGETDVYFQSNDQIKIESVEDLEKITNSFENKYKNVAKSIEIGHCFYLEHVYSKPMNASFKNSKNELENFFMGCYGIGVTRLLSAIFSNRKNENYTWPRSISPFKLHIIDKDGLGLSFYEKYKDTMDILYDDRDISMGEKFKDADLIGIPDKLIMGNNIEYIYINKKHSLNSAEEIFKFIV